MRKRLGLPLTKKSPGSGAVTRAIEAWRAEGRLPLYQANVTNEARDARAGKDA